MGTAACLGTLPHSAAVLVVSANTVFRKRFRENSDSPADCVEEAYGGADALSKLRSIRCRKLVLDCRIPDLYFREVVEIIKCDYPNVEVLLVDSESTQEAPGQAPLDDFPNSGRTYVAGGQSTSASDSDGTALESRSLEAPRVSTEACESLPGMQSWANAMQKIYRLARLVSLRDTTILITGETGTGKELVARGIHKIGTRAQSPFVVVNCAAIPETLLEAELFGHTRGAFTGAVQSRLGRIHAAHGGTLFLDEVGELPLSMQAKLLRFLQDGEVQRLGSSDVFRVDVRVICATNANLHQRVKEKLFRIDLYYRLAVFPIDLPPLRERPEDIVRLAEHILAELCTQAGLPPKTFSPSVQVLLQKHSWPGNVRELQHALERASILSGDDPGLTIEHFSMAT